MIRDVLEIIQVKDIPVIGLLLLALAVLGWFYHRLLKNVEGIRAERENERIEHKKEIQSLNDKHAAKIEELTGKLMSAIKENGNAYKQSTEALQMILKANRE